jgi:hypothetical protein
MQLPTILQGRPFGAQPLAQIQSLLDRSGGHWSRYRLSRELAVLWNWRTAHGQLKDMAARTLLLKLQEQGWIRLPALRRKSPTRSGQPRAAEGPGLDPNPIEGALASLTPLRWQEVSQTSPPGGRAQLEACLDRYHYLGYRSRVGQNLQYWVYDRRQRPVACVVFGAAAWQCAARDQWIGWSADQRARHLGGVVNNTRLLLLPWVRVPHLASHILGGVSRQICRDWEAKYRQPIWLLETFVDRHRFAGTCYRAANWILLGQTQGRGRQGPRSQILSTTIKDVYVWPLHPDFRRHLTAAQNHDPSPPNPSSL